MKTYKALLNTKFIGKHIVKIEARNDAEAVKKAKRLENEYNKVIAIKAI